MDERHFEIAAEQRLALFDKAAIDGRAERADDRDGGGAERQAGEENPEALEPRAQIAPGEGKPERGLTDWRPRRCARRAPATMRSQRLATARIMGDEEQRRAVLALEREQQIDDLRSGLLVEIAGRLVGEDDPGARRERARDGDALLLAARKLARIVGQPVAEPDALEMRLRHCARHRRRPLNSSGTATFSSAVMVGMRWKDWNTMPMASRRKSASVILLLAGERCAMTAMWPDAHLLEAGDHHEQASSCRNPRARRCRAPRRLATWRSTPRRMSTGPGPARQRQTDIFEGNGRRGHWGLDGQVPQACPDTIGCHALWRCDEARGTLDRTAMLARLAILIALLMTPLTTASAKTLTILALGDSLTAGYGLASARGLPGESSKRRSRPGATTCGSSMPAFPATRAIGGRDRLDWSLTDDIDAVIVELGANDALRGIDPKETQAALDAILAEISKRKLPVLIAGMLAPRNLGPDYGKAFDAIFPALAERYGALFYPFFLDGVAVGPSPQPGGWAASQPQRRRS